MSEIKQTVDTSWWIKHPDCLPCHPRNHLHLTLTDGASVDEIDLSRDITTSKIITIYLHGRRERTELQCIRCCLTRRLVGHPSDIPYIIEASKTPLGHDVMISLHGVYEESDAKARLHPNVLRRGTFLGWKSRTPYGNAEHISSLPIVHLFLKSA